MKNRVMRRVPWPKKILLSMNLDTSEQLIVLLKMFLPMLVLGGVLQCCLSLGGYDVQICGFIFMLYALTAVLFLDTKEQICMLSDKEQCVRNFKMVLNIGLGILYLGISFLAFIWIFSRVADIFNTGINEEVSFLILLMIAGCAFAIWLILVKYRNKLFFVPPCNFKSFHHLNIENEDFVQIENNSKNIEFRLADNKRKRIKVGDILVFYNVDDMQCSVAEEVGRLHFAGSFAELLAQTDIKKSYGGDISEELYKLNQIYPPERQKKKGVIGIEFKRKNATQGDKMMM